MKSDIAHYWGLLDPEGVLVLDDYLTWPGVTQAVNEFDVENDIIPHGERGKVALSKNGRFKVTTKLFTG